MDRAIVVRLTGSELARRLNISRAAVSAAKKPGGPIADAVTPDGKHINAAHPSVVRWAERHGVGVVELVGARVAKRLAERLQKDQSDRIGADADAVSVDGIMSLTLGEIVDRFGNAEGLEEWLAPRKIAEEIRRLEIQNTKARGELIERALVAAAFDDVSRSIQDFVTNSPQTIVIENRAMAQNGTSIEDAIAATRKLVSGELRPGLDSAAKRLRDAER